MQVDHKEQLKIYTTASPKVGKLLFALTLLSDIVKSEYKGKELLIHLEDVKELIVETAREMFEERGIL